MKKTFLVLFSILVAGNSYAAQQDLETVTNPAYEGNPATLQHDDVRLTAEANSVKQQAMNTEIFTKIDPIPTWPNAISASELENLDGSTGNIQDQLDGKQATLVSGTNIKTINGTSLLGSGDIVISGTVDDTAYDATSWDGNTDAPTKNAVRDKIETIAGGTMTYPSSGNIGYTTNGTSWSAMALDTDLTTVSASDDSVPSAKATKAALDLKTDDQTAAEVSYDNTTSGLTANNVKDAIDEVDAAGITINFDAATMTTSGENPVTAGVKSGVFQAADADLTTYAGITPSANVQSYLGAATYAAMRALLDLEVGTDFNAYDADIADLADGSLTGSKVGTGISASNVTTGTLPAAQLPTAATQEIFSGTATLGTTSIADGDCATGVAVTATGVATTDIPDIGYQTDPIGTDGYDFTVGPVLSIIPRVTANTITVYACNYTGASVTPEQMVINIRVDR